jgi:hypothetical protein
MNKTPIWFTVVAIVALLWNLAGLFAVVADLRLSPAEIAALPQQQQALYAARPVWSIVASVVAVGLRWPTRSQAMVALGSVRISDRRCRSRHWHICSRWRGLGAGFGPCHIAGCSVCHRGCVGLPRAPGSSTCLAHVAHGRLPLRLTGHAAACRLAQTVRPTRNRTLRS